MSSREKILNKLRAVSAPFPQVSPGAASYRPMTPLDQADSAALKARFIQEAESISAIVHQPADEEEAVEVVLSILGEDSQVIAWDFEQIPLAPLAAALQVEGIAVAAPGDPQVRVGLSGAQAALAATGSLLVTSGQGRYRTASLLPPVHVALITEDQILPHLESWVARQRADDLVSFRQASNIVIISGPSRTADIAMELILGMHGPAELHIVILPS